MFKILFHISILAQGLIPVAQMAKLRSHGIGVPILFPIDAHDIVVVSGLHLSIRFSLQASSIWLEREIFHPNTGLLLHTLHETSKLTDNGNVVWEFGTGNYRVYGLPDSQMGVSLEILTPLRWTTLVCERRAKSVDLESVERR
jgi:hypothetical protein